MVVADDTSMINEARRRVRAATTLRKSGLISRIRGLLIECVGLNASVADICYIHSSGGATIMAEVVGIHAPSRTAQLMPYNDLRGISGGDTVTCANGALRIGVGQELMGRVVNACGTPIDHGDALHLPDSVSVYPQELNPFDRVLIRDQLASGVRAIDAFVPVGVGQRLGIFSGSGVGKSVLMGMIARNTSADINVIALIGERSREVREFVDNELGSEGLKRSIVVASTSEVPPLARLRGAFTALAIAEYFRDLGNNVLLFFDSVTRFAMAQREIGLSIGEPPATRGYPPSVFSLLPQMLERCGTRARGSITGFFSVLVEGDDMEEPISDAMRGLLDGHVVLSRSRAQRNLYPAIDILQSISRLEHTICTPEMVRAAADIRRKVALYRESEDLIQVGAYQSGSNKALDAVIEDVPAIELFLKQGIRESVAIADTQRQLAQLSDANKREQAA